MLKTYKEKNVKLFWRADLNNRNDIAHLWVGGLYILKIVILPTSVYKFSATPTKIPKGFITELDKIILKLIWKERGPRKAKEILKEQNRET